MDVLSDTEMGSNGNFNNEGEEKAATYLPGQPLKEDEELMCDESVYVMLHEVHTGKNILHVVRAITLMSQLSRIRSGRSLVGITTSYGFDGRGIWVRFPGAVGHIILYIAQTDSRAHPVSYPMGAGGEVRA
jgi:hypothetical protein